MAFAPRRSSRLAALTEAPAFALLNELDEDLLLATARLALAAFVRWRHGAAAVAAAAGTSRSTLCTQTRGGQELWHPADDVETAAQEGEAPIDVHRRERLQAAAVPASHQRQGEACLPREHPRHRVGT